MHALFAYADDIVILNPAYELKNSGITNISKIELKDNETRIHVHCTFIPNWWVKFEGTYIQDCATGKKFLASGIENGEFDKEIYMPSSGDSTFVIIFPKLDKSIIQIDYGDSGKIEVFGISLDPNNKAFRSKEIPANVNDWINEELGKAKRKTPINLDSDEFFTKEPAKIIGYIKGYDRRLGFSTGIIYSGSEITREDYPTVIEVHEDGRFEATIPMNHPEYTYLSLSKALLNYYIEPGQTLAIVLDWDEFLEADRYRNDRYKFKDVLFMGPLAQINKELDNVNLVLKRPPYSKVYSDEVKKMKPSEYKAYQEEFTKEYRAELQALLMKETTTPDSKTIQAINSIKDNDGLNALLEKEPLSPQTKTILGINSMVEYASFLYEYESNYKYAQKQDNQDSIPIEFYDFLQDIPLNDQRLLLSSSFSTFINRFEYCIPFEASYNIYEQFRPKKEYDEYLFGELELLPSDEDKDFIQAMDSINHWINDAKISEQDKEKFLSEFTKKGEVFHSKYEKYKDEYKKKYLDGIPEMTQVNINLERWEIKDSIYTDVLKLKPGLIYDIAKTRSLDYVLGESLKNKDDARIFLTAFEKDISHPFLKQESERLFLKNYPDQVTAGYPLPKGDKGAEIMRKIIDPFNGKMLFVDFWGIFCGPCISGIKDKKETRAKYKDNPDFEFIFITSEGESPLDRYNIFVKEQELQNTYRLTEDEYLYLRQLFKFNGIPRYIVIDKDGLVLNDNFSMHNFEYELPKLLGKDNDTVTD
ncbi:MAG: TlpA family protein disulfide reductase [Dysgonomonas sp.]